MAERETDTSTPLSREQQESQTITPLEKFRANSKAVEHIRSQMRSYADAFHRTPITEDERSTLIDFDELVAEGERLSRVQMSELTDKEALFAFYRQYRQLDLRWDLCYAQDQELYSVRIESIRQEKTARRVALEKQKKEELQKKGFAAIGSKRRIRQIDTEIEILDYEKETNEYYNDLQVEFRIKHDRMRKPIQELHARVDEKVENDFHFLAAELKVAIDTAAETLKNDSEFVESIRGSLIKKRIDDRLADVRAKGDITSEDVTRFEVLSRQLLVPGSRDIEGADKEFYRKLSRTNKTLSEVVMTISTLRKSPPLHLELLDQLSTDYARSLISQTAEELKDTSLPLVTETFLYAPFKGEYNVSRSALAEGYDSLERNFLWSLIRENSTITQSFGEFIQREDTALRNKHIENLMMTNRAYSSGEIDALQFWHTDPDVLAAMILVMANQDDHNSNLRVEVNNSLHRFEEEPDWKDAIEQLARKHPELSSVCSAFSAGNYDGIRLEDALFGKIDAYALSVYKDGRKSESERHVAFFALQTESILQLLESKLTEQENISIQKTLRHLHETLVGIQDELEAHSSIFEEKIRSYAQRFLGNSEIDEKEAQTFRNLLSYGEKIQEATSTQMYGYYLNSRVISMIEFSTDDPDQFATICDALTYCPELATYPASVDQVFSHPENHLTPDGLRLVHSVHTLFADLDEDTIYKINTIVGAKKINEKQLKAISTRLHSIQGDENFSVVTGYYELFLLPENGIDLYIKLKTAYAVNPKLIKTVANCVEGNFITLDTAFLFAQQSPLILKEGWENTVSFLFQNADTVLKTAKDAQFFNDLVGRHGKPAAGMIREYQECFVANKISAADQPLLLEFTDKFRTISEALFAGYKDAKANHTVDVYLTGIKSLTAKLIGSGEVSDAERERPYFDDLIRYVYPNHSERWASYENVKKSNDRSSDVEKYKVRASYDIDFLAETTVRLKNKKTQVGEKVDYIPEQLDEARIESTKKNILDYGKKASEMHYDTEPLKAMLSGEIEIAFAQLQNIQELGIDDIAELSNEMKLSILFLDRLYGQATISMESIKSLFISYQFTELEDVKAYIAGTSDRVDGAKNRDYALLSELHSFYTDRIKESSRVILQKASKDPRMEKILQLFFERYAKKQSEEAKLQNEYKLRIGTLGPSDSFYESMSKVIRKKDGGKYTLAQIKKIMDRYEVFANGLTEKQTTSTKGRTKAVYGQLRVQRERTRDAIAQLSGKDLDLASLHLSELTVQDYLDSTSAILSATFDPEQFGSYTIQRMIETFAQETEIIETELSKFEAESGKDRKVLRGYIRKSKETAYARMPAGVCVSGDEKMWNMDNFLQMIFEDPDSGRSQGVIMMHEYLDQGKRVLTVSMNPSMTYLYQVDESALFDGIMKQLERFAQENNFDMITLSRNKQIRTNRTGGQFEAAMDKRVSAIGKMFTFTNQVDFSFSPVYKMKDMDVIWEKPVTAVEKSPRS